MNVGELLGLIVGDAVGAVKGISVGLIDGDIVGLMVGVLDGEILGDPVGCHVGEVVGFKVYVFKVKISMVWYVWPLLPPLTINNGYCNAILTKQLRIVGK